MKCWVEILKCKWKLLWLSSSKYITVEYQVHSYPSTWHPVPPGKLTEKELYQKSLEDAVKRTKDGCVHMHYIGLISRTHIQQSGYYRIHYCFLVAVLNPN